MQDIFTAVAGMLTSGGFIVLATLAASGAFIHFRGQERHKLSRQITSYTTFLAPLNILIYAFSKVPNRPYQDLADFPELQLLRDNWEVVREEAQALYSQDRIQASDGINDVGFYSLFKTGWRRFYLTWYGNTLPSAETLCPQTLTLLRQIPSVRAAMFASLPPGAKLMKHRDPFAGSLRYHLGLFTPNDDRCRIIVDQQPYSWRDGEDVLFDETFIHYAENRTDQPRIILFCDVERPMHTPVMRLYNRVVGNLLGNATAARNTPDEPLGVINRVFDKVYGLRRVSKRLKAWNESAYYALKFTLIGLLLYLIIF